MSVPLHDVAPDRLAALLRGLVLWVADDAALGQDNPLTYREARVKFAVRGNDQGLGKVLDNLWHSVRPFAGEDVATGFCAYVVEGRTRQPAEGWNRHFDRTVRPESARAIARDWTARYISTEGRAALERALGA